MDIYASAALTGAGYALSKQRDTLKNNEMSNYSANPSDLPSMKNMYYSDYNRDVLADQRTRGMKMFADSQTPFQTGVVPRPAYADMFASPETDYKVSNDSYQNQIRTLAGETLTRENFTHNNMEPFFHGTVKQNVNVENSSYATKLENFTGRSDLYQRKKEVGCFFEPTKHNGNPCGFMPDQTDFFIKRTIPPKARNNDFPIEQIRVGKGLGSGFTSDPEGGFQQSKTLDYVRPKTVDELRVATNPRITYKTGPKGPQAKTFQRGIVSKFNKNRPEKFYEQDQNMLLKTTGAHYKESNRPVQNIKATAKVDTHIQYEGNAFNKTAEPGQGYNDDYGLDSVMVFENSRMYTEQNNIITNLTSSVKSIIAPVLDIFRHSIKEYTIDASRQNGNLQAQIPSKPTTYDPVNHMMKTTIKETTIHDTTVSNLKGNDKGTVPNLDEAKTTGRETLPPEDDIRNISGHTYNVTIYNIDDIAKTTVRETTKETSSMFGFIGGKTQQDSAGAYSVIDIEMKNTQKQFISNYEYEGIAGSQNDFRPTSEEADFNAQIDPTRESILLDTANTPGAGGTYVGFTAENIDMESKRLISDSITPRDTQNQTRVYQDTAMPVKECAVTKPGVFLNANKDRLDGALLNSLASNPYNIGINPIRNGCIENEN